MAESSSVTCTASSRVGTRTSALGRLSRLVVRSTIGIANARVLPDPVGDFASTSRPASASGRTKDWIVNGSRIERTASASHARGHAELAEDCCDMVFDSFTGSRLAYLETPEGGTRSSSHRPARLPTVGPG